MASPAGGPTPSPISRQELKDLAQSQLGTDLTGQNFLVTHVKEINGSYTFKVKDQYKTYTVTVGKDVLAQLTDDQAKKDWSKGLALQIGNMYKYNSLRTGLNMAEKSITIDDRTYYFATQQQVLAHRDEYARLRGNQPTIKEKVRASEQSLGAANQALATEKNESVKVGKSWLSSKKVPKDPAKVKQLEAALQLEKENRAEVNAEKDDNSRQIKVMEQLHLIAGQLFVEGGLDHLLPAAAGGTTISDVTDIPELPEMATRPGTTGIIASTTDVPPPSTYRNFNELDVASLADEPAVETRPMGINDGMTPKVVALLRSAAEFVEEGPSGTAPIGNLTPISELERNDYTKLEVQAVIRGVQRIKKGLQREGGDLSTSTDRKKVIAVLKKELDEYETALIQLRTTL